MTKDSQQLAFEKSLADSGITNIETGFVENTLFEEGCDKSVVANREVKVFFFVRKASRKNAPYMIFLNGGPGFAATDLFLPNRYDSFLPEYNVVFFDQRGNGLSDHPNGDVRELRYFSARYIISDAEKIRERLLGPKSKWTIFGQSYGGVVARKYIEYAPRSIARVITHGSAKYNAVEEAIAMEIATAKRADSYFSQFPDDRKKIEEIKAELSDADDIQSSTFSLKGKGIIHLLAVLFSIKSDHDFHDLIQSLNPSSLKESYLDAIKPFAQLILKGGLLSQVVAQIDLIGDMFGDELTDQTKSRLLALGIDLQKSVFSKVLFDEAVTPISDDFKMIDAFFRQKQFASDTVDLDKLIEITNNMNLRLDAFGGLEDTLALQAIKNEEHYSRRNNAKNIFYHYTNGHHREWLTNSQLFKDVL